MEVQSTAGQSQTFAASVRPFFYAEEVPYGLAIIRIVLPLILLCVAVPRWSHSRELFSSDGAAAPLAVNYGYHNFPPEPSGTVAVAMMTALVFCLVASSIGWHTRISLLASWGLYTYLNMLDCLSTFTKYSVIASHVLLLLSLSNCGAIWSVDRWRQGADQSRGTGSAWPRRLIQLLIGCVYFGAAFTKMHTDGFMSSDQLRYWLLSNVNNDNPVGELLAMYPAFIITMSHVAVVWQVLFVFLSWRGRARVVMLGIGATFHLATVWLLGLHIFPPIMITTYFAWLNADDVRRLRPRIRQVVSRIPTKATRQVVRTYREAVARVQQPLATVPSAMLFFIGISATVVSGTELEYQLDAYSRRGPSGPLSLQPLDEPTIRRLFRNDRSIRESDKFFALEIGTETLGGVVVHRRTEFQPGESLIAQCSLVPPHGDMWLECRVEDTAERQLGRFGQPVTRDMLRVNFTYDVPADLDPGEYRLIVRSDGEDVLHRTIRVGP